MRKYLVLSLLALSFLGSFTANAATEIRGIHLTYQRVLHPADRNGFPIPQLITGGYVDAVGAFPVYVTLSIGGQRITQPTDAQGQFSFFAYTAGAGNYEVEAWTVDPTVGGIEAKTKAKVVKISGDISSSK